MATYSEMQRESKAFAMRMISLAKQLENDCKRYGVQFPYHFVEQINEETNCFLKNIK